MGVTDEMREQVRPLSSGEELHRARAELAARVADATRLGPIGAPPRTMTDIRSALDEVLRTVLSLLDASGGVLMLYDPERDEMFPQAALGVPPALLHVLNPLHRPVGARGTGVATVAPLVVPDVRVGLLTKPFADAATAADVQAVYSIPMISLGDELMGSIVALFPEPHVPTDEQIELVDAYARQAAEMVERARMHGEARQLALLERRRAAQLRALADSAVALSSAGALDELLRVLTESAREVIGAHQAVATRSGEGGTTIVSLSEKYGEFRDAGVDEVASALVAEALRRDRRPVRATRDDVQLHPHWRSVRERAGAPPFTDCLAAPLVARDGGPLGFVRLSDKVDGGEFTAEDEAMLVQLARTASVAVENLELVERERAAREEAERTARLRGLLADASQAFAASLELDATLRTLSSLTVPALADWVAVHLVAESGAIDPAYVHHHDPDRERVLQDLLGHAAATPGVTEVLRTGTHRVLTDPADDAAVDSAYGEAYGDEHRAAGPRSRILVPLTARGRTFGALSLVRERGTSYTDSDVLLARELADRAALAVDNASRFTLEREVAATLQRSLLPQDLPVTQALETASRYLPGASGTRIGGDWYDVVALDDGSVAMVVGDVMGRGVTAAAVMGQVRAAVRAYTLEGHPPAELLARLDRVVQALGGAELTTCIYAVYDPAARRLTVASAGHPPALLIPPDGPPWYVETDPGLPLGVGNEQFAETSVEVAPGTVLLLYTDGLIESPDSGVDEGMAALRDAVPAPVGGLDALCDRVLHALGRDGSHEDDTALLAVCFTGAPSGTASPSPVLELAPAPESVARSRRFVGERVGDLLDPEQVELAQLLVSELVTNAIRHARSPVAVRLVALPHALRVDVTDESTAPPVVRDDADDTAEGGRGLKLVDVLADRWGHERLLSGKRVWFELARG